MDTHEITVVDEYKALGEFFQKSYSLLYDIAKLFLLLNSAFVAIIGYAVTATVTTSATITSTAIVGPAAYVLFWALFFVPLLGAVIGCMANMLHRRLAKYVQVFLLRGKEIEQSVNDHRLSKAQVHLFTNIEASYHLHRDTWLGNKVKHLYLVDLGYLGSSIFWLVALVFLNDFSILSVLFAAASAGVILWIFARLVLNYDFSLSVLFAAAWSVLSTKWRRPS